MARLLRTLGCFVEPQGSNPYTSFFIKKSMSGGAFRESGLHFADAYIEHPENQLAMTRMPPRIPEMRHRRVRIATYIDVKHAELPEEAQDAIRQHEFDYYAPYVAIIDSEKQEKDAEPL